MSNPSRQFRLPGLDPEEPPAGDGESAGAEAAGAEAAVIAESKSADAVPAADALPETVASGAPEVAPLTTAEPISEDAVSLGEAAELPRSLRGKTVYVVDSHSLIFQVFHALPEMTSPRGEPVGAVFGFTRDVMFLLEQKKPDYLFCAFDMHGPTFRHEMFAGYKEHRAEMPPDLIPQIPAIRRMLDVLGIPALGLAGYEADDVLATVARIVADRGGECVLVTGDKDCRQLLGERVKMFDVRKNRIFDAAALVDDWGIRPEQVVDYQALVGDPVNNIKGVPLIGPKIARELLQKYGTLDNLYEHVAELPAGKRRENLLLHREQAYHEPRVGPAERRDADRHRLAAGAGGRFRSGPGSRSVRRIRLPHAHRKNAQPHPAAAHRLAGRLSNDRYAGKARGAGGRNGPPTEHFARHRDDQHFAAVGRDRRLFVFVERRAGLLSARPRRPARRGSIRTRRSRPCAPSWKTSTSAKSARISNTI